jgi:1,4-alpha-glucan branching enzyme
MKTKIQARKLPSSSQCKVRVEVRNPEAKQVTLAGTFNNWQADAHPLQPQEDGWWTTELTLPAGCYEYRFVIDGRWTSNPQAPKFVRNPYGSFNSILEIEGT